MPKIEIDIPVETDYSPQELKEFFAAKLYKEGLISSGTGARMLGIERRDFILLLAKYNVDYVNYSVEELKEEIENL